VGPDDYVGTWWCRSQHLVAFRTIGIQPVWLITLCLSEDKRGAHAGNFVFCLRELKLLLRNDIPAFRATRRACTSYGATPSPLKELRKHHTVRNTLG
jgi:hypothetical protein